MYLKRIQTISSVLSSSEILSLVLSSLTRESICAKLSLNMTCRVSMVTKVHIICVSRSPAASTLQHSSGPSLCSLFLKCLASWAAQPNKICPSPGRLSSTSSDRQTSRSSIALITQIIYNLKQTMSLWYLEILTGPHLLQLLLQILSGQS